MSKYPKWGWLIVIALTFAIGGAVTEAQQPTKISRTEGYLSNNDAVREAARAEATGLALRELGYIEGQNLATEYGEGKRDRDLELAADLVRLKV